MEKNRLPGGMPWSEDPLGCKKNRWCLTSTLFLGIGVWKCCLSALCWHELQTTAQSYGCLPGMGPAKGRSIVKYSMAMLPESLKFEVSKLSHSPVIKKAQTQVG